VSWSQQIWVGSVHHSNGNDDKQKYFTVAKKVGMVLGEEHGMHGMLDMRDETWEPKSCRQPTQQSLGPVENG
jgi:hypothetical protein